MLQGCVLASNGDGNMHAERVWASWAQRKLQLLALWQLPSICCSSASPPIHLRRFSAQFCVYWDVEPRYVDVTEDCLGKPGGDCCGATGGCVEARQSAWHACSLTSQHGCTTAASATVGDLHSSAAQSCQTVACLLPRVRCPLPLTVLDPEKMRDHIDENTIGQCMPRLPGYICVPNV